MRWKVLKKMFSTHGFARQGTPFQRGILKISLRLLRKREGIHELAKDLASYLTTVSLLPCGQFLALC